MAKIEIRGVTKHFGDTVALAGADLSIEDGELFILVGPSGCGKSTLLNIVVGLETPTEGDVLVDGESQAGVDPRARNMAMVFQSYAIYPHMTVRENMAFPLRMAGVSREEQARRVEEAAEVLELGGLLDRTPRALSGGQRQRVAMGRAIVREPRAFLLDEPLSNLDAKLRVQMRTEIARLQRRLGTTTLYVTHDQTEAMTLGDRLAVMRAGRILQVGTPQQLYDKPQHLFVAAFIGSPAMNFLPARSEGDTLVTPFGRVEDVAGPGDREPESEGAERAALAIGFRPETIDLAGDDHAVDGLHFDARVEIVEWLGADLYVHLACTTGEEQLGTLPKDLAGGDHRTGRLVARVDPALEVEEGQTRTFAVPRHQLHLFGLDDERALGRLGGPRRRDEVT